MDFGCGVGRLTRALAVHFDEVYGVDISPAMLRLAREYNAHVPNCIFVQNPDPSFRAVPVSDFDLIYSTITLQHMPPRHAMRYLRALVGRLRPGGLLVFQLVDRCRTPLAERLCSILYQEIFRRHLLRAQPAMDVYGVDKQRVIALIEQSGCRILDVEPNDGAGPAWTSYRYAAVREEAAGPMPDHRDLQAEN
jgi:trans-aconitate methyltransferase